MKKEIQIKLTDLQIKMIRAFYKKGLGDQSQLAEIFNTSQSVIENILDI